MCRGVAAGCPAFMWPHVISVMALLGNHHLMAQIFLWDRVLGGMFYPGSNNEGGWGWCPHQRCSCRPNR